jgi:PAS domain S-box-containing protein
VSFLENTTDFIYFKDGNSRFRFCSQALARVTGYASWRDMVGKRDRDVFPADIAQIHHEDEWQIVRQGRPLLNKVEAYQDADGNPGWISTNKWPLTDHDGTVTGMFAISRDITRSMAYESELQQAKLSTEAANIAKSRFLAAMSHEIRTPMNGILGMAQMLLMPNTTAGERTDYARTILTSGRTLLALLNDILDLSKIEAGKIELENTVFAPAQLVRETQALFAGSARDKGLELRAHWRAAPTQRYRSDVHRLRQMLSNLVGNAIKFTAQGGVRIEGSEVERLGDSALLEFSVSDTGIGIPAEKIDLLFKPFSQADSSTTREFGGTGLGLSIVNSLAKLIGGDVGVDSVPRQGFALLVPRARRGCWRRRRQGCRRRRWRRSRRCGNGAPATARSRAGGRGQRGQSPGHRGDAGQAWPPGQCEGEWPGGGRRHPQRRARSTWC